MDLNINKIVINNSMNSNHPFKWIKWKKIIINVNISIFRFFFSIFISFDTFFLSSVSRKTVYLIEKCLAVSLKYANECCSMRHLRSQGMKTSNRDDDYCRAATAAAYSL